MIIMSPHSSCRIGDSDVVTVIIPGDAISSELDFHRFLAKELDFGPHYGKNLDALWDRLSTDIERPVHVVWESAELSRQQLGAESFERIASLLKRVEASDVEAGYRERFTVAFQD
jgi:ribonuclease inhibitor